MDSNGCAESVDTEPTLTVVYSCAFLMPFWFLFTSLSSLSPLHSGTMTSSMIHWENVTVLHLTRGKMAFQLALTLTQLMALTPSLHWDIAPMEELTTRWAVEWERRCLGAGGVQCCFLLTLLPLFSWFYVCICVTRWLSNLFWFWSQHTLLARDTIPYIYHKRVTE